MDGKSQNPFEVMDDLLENDDSDIHIVDIHAEATSEKVALGYYLDGRVPATLLGLELDDTFIISIIFPPQENIWNKSIIYLWKMVIIEV